jgi:hypothetical protein
MDYFTTKNTEYKNFNFNISLLENDDFVKEFTYYINIKSQSLLDIKDKEDREKAELELNIEHDEYRLKHHFYHISKTNCLDQFKLKMDEDNCVFKSMKETAFSKFYELADEKRKILKEKFKTIRKNIEEKFNSNILSIELKYNLEFNAKQKYNDEKYEQTDETLPKKPRRTIYLKNGTKVAYRKHESK